MHASLSWLPARWWKQRPLSPFSRRRSALAAALALVAALIVLPACTAGGNGVTIANTGKSNVPTSTATTPPTPTPKPKPTAVPTTSVAYCQGLLSLAEANSAMKPAAPATTILFENDTANHLSACSWTPGQNIAVLAVFFVPFPPGTSFNAAAQQLAKAHAPTGIATTPVSGVGDQALYLSATIPTPSGANYAADLIVADGGILLGCAQTGAGSVPAALQAELAQACKEIVSRL